MSALLVLWWTVVAERRLGSCRCSETGWKIGGGRQTATTGARPSWPLRIGTQGSVVSGRRSPVREFTLQSRPGAGRAAGAEKKIADA
jgi:hypothetical protein